MVLKLEQNNSQDDIEVLIKFQTMDKTVESIVSFIKSIDDQIECFSRDNIKIVNVSDIYYIESVEKTSVVFCEKEKYQTNFRLYQLKEKLSEKGFIQISKYCIINLNKIDMFKPLFNSRMEAIMKNGKSLLINRQFLSSVKRIVLDA